MERLDLDQPLEGFRSFRRGLEFLHRGEFEDASREFKAAREWAVEESDDRLVDRALIYGWAIVIAGGEFDHPIPELRSVLHRGDRENCFLAAYNIARAFECKKEYRKGHFYARLASQHAEQIGHPEWLGWSRNQLGNFHMALGETSLAMNYYREAMKHIESSKLSWLSLVHQNIGYGHLISGNTREGFRHLFYSLRNMRRLGLDSSLLHLDLAWGYLEIDRPHWAAKHAQLALDLAEEEGSQENTKNALLMLGQAARSLTQKGLADRCYRQLESFYPGQEQWITMVKGININSLISLRA